MNECEFRQNGLCMISTTLAKVEVEATDGACGACLKQDMPASINKVTCQRARFVLIQNNMPVPNEIKGCSMPNKNGVGTHFERIVNNSKKYFDMLGIGSVLEKKEGCGCDAMKASLNNASTYEIEERFDQVAEDINNKWVESHPSLRHMKPITLIASKHVLRKAIKQARKEMAED